jgi:hypothetical protein
VGFSPAPVLDGDSRQTAQIDASRLEGAEGMPRAQCFELEEVSILFIALRDGKKREQLLARVGYFVTCVLLMLARREIDAAHLAAPSQREPSVFWKMPCLLQARIAIPLPIIVLVKDFILCTLVP